MERQNTMAAVFAEIAQRDRHESAVCTSHGARPGTADLGRAPIRAKAERRQQGASRVRIDQYIWTATICTTTAATNMTKSG